MQDRQGVLKPEMGEFIEIKYEDEEEVVYGDL